MSVCLCVCVCVLCQAHKIIWISFDGKTPDVFKTKTSSKIFSHMVRSDRSNSLFYSLLQAKCRDRSPTAGNTLTVILLETFFYLLWKIIAKRAGTCRIDTANSHINRGRESKKYMNICNSYNYIPFKILYFIYLWIYNIQCRILPAIYSTLNNIHQPFYTQISNTRIKHPFIHYIALPDDQAVSPRNI